MNNHSSLPSSTSTSPGLSTSRPTTPVTSGVGGLSSGSRPLSPAAVNDGGDVSVSKTNVANKRLRKKAGEDTLVEDGSNGCNGPGPPKRLATASQDDIKTTSGEFLVAMDGDTRDSSVMSPGGSNTCDSFISSKVPPPLPQASNVGSGVSTRRKSRRSVEQQQPSDVLEQQMQSIRKGAGKVRTTQEIVQELALRSHSSAGSGLLNNRSLLPREGSEEGLDANESKSELMKRFFESQTNLGGSSNNSIVSPPLSTAPSPPSSSLLQSNPTSPVTEGATGAGSRTETVEDVMARLPVISASEVLASWTEDEEEQEPEGLIPVMREPEIVTDGMVDRLHDENVESFNGNFNHLGEFREWHEMLTRVTKEGELLHVLPYSIID